MAHTIGQHDVEEANEQLARMIGLLLGGWILVFFLASVALVLWGDALMELFA